MAVMILQARKRIGGYELDRQLGEGGMGEVWLAHDTYADRPVALKFIKPHLLAEPGFRTRFSNEAKTLGKLDHDRIVTLYAVIEEGEHLALVLRFIDGRALSDKIDEEGALPPEFVTSCAGDILPALEFAHQQGIIHRDIKPQNILVDRKTRSFLTDFGIAVAAFAERATVTGGAIGTPHYMSPEQIRTPREVCIENGGHRTDIYSFGIVLFEMLTGQLPFGRDSGMEDMYSIYQAHCNEAPPSLRAIKESLPGPLDEVVRWCLEKDPALRPQNCSQLLQQLQLAVKGESRARPATVLLGVNDVPVHGSTLPYQAAAAAAPSSSARPKKIPQVAWLGLGGLVIAGGIGFAIFTKPTAHQQPAPPPAVVKPNTDTSTQPPKPNQSPLAGTPIRRPVGGNNIGVTNTAPPAVKPPLPSGPTAEQIQAKQEADKEYTIAHNLFQQGELCGSEDHFNQAMKLFPESKWASEQRSATKGCNLQ